MIGGFFKWHWNNPQEITYKIDDPKNPLNAPFKKLSGPLVINRRDLHLWAATPTRARTCAC